MLPVLIDFPVSNLLDDTAYVDWLEQQLHSAGLVCSRCQSTDRRLSFFETQD